MRIGVVGVAQMGKKAVVREVAKRLKFLNQRILDVERDVVQENKFYKQLELLLKSYFIAAEDDIITNKTLIEAMAYSLLLHIKGEISGEQYNILTSIFSLAMKMMQYDLLVYLPYEGTDKDLQEVDHILQRFLYNSGHGIKIIKAEPVFEKTIDLVVEAVENVSMS